MYKRELCENSNENENCKKIKLYEDSNKNPRKIKFDKCLEIKFDKLLKRKLYEAHEKKLDYEHYQKYINSEFYLRNKYKPLILAAGTGGLRYRS